MCKAKTLCLSSAYLIHEQLLCPAFVISCKFLSFHTNLGIITHFENYCTVKQEVTACQALSFTVICISLLYSSLLLCSLLYVFLSIFLYSTPLYFSTSVLILVTFFLLYIKVSYVVCSVFFVNTIG